MTTSHLTGSDSLAYLIEQVVRVARSPELREAMRRVTEAVLAFRHVDLAPYRNLSLRISRALVGVNVPRLDLRGLGGNLNLDAIGQGWIGSRMEEGKHTWGKGARYRLPVSPSQGADVGRGRRPRHTQRQGHGRGR